MPFQMCIRDRKKSFIEDLYEDSKGVMLVNDILNMQNSATEMGKELGKKTMAENPGVFEKYYTVSYTHLEKNQSRIKKELLPTLPGGLPVLCHHADHSRAEAVFIAAKIQELHEKGTPYRDMTILYRAHYITRTIEEIFLKEKIPYTIYSGVQFFGRMEIKDALSYLRMIAYKDDLSFLRIANVPKRNIGQRRLAFLQEYAAEKNCTLYDALIKNIENDIFKGTKAASFVALIESFAADYAERPISEVLSAILNESGYERMLRTEGSQEPVSYTHLDVYKRKI